MLFHNTPLDWLVRPGAMVIERLSASMILPNATEGFKKPVDTYDIP
jgi:hypothetical protein